MRSALLVTVSVTALAGLAGPALAAVDGGSSGPDTLTGSAAADVLAGRGGADDLYGAAGRDALSGGPGPDQVLGGRGRDVLSGGPGADQLHADDGGRDVVSCGPGTDTVFAERQDVVAGDCERDGKALLRGGALATFDVNGERFRAWVRSPTGISQLLALATGESTATIPVASVRRGSGRAASNSPYSWHLDPDDFSMADFTIEVCDATPSHVERNREEFMEVVRAYCPWSARLVEVRNYGGRAEAPPESPPGGELPGAP